MLPLVIVCLVSCCVVLPLAMEYFIRWFYFLGSAGAIIAYQVSQALLLLLYLRVFQPYNKKCWPGLGAWRETLHWEAFRIYFFLGIGGMVATSEWIYWEVLSLAIGTLGTTVLAVHTVPTQVLTVSFMIPLGIGM